MIGLNGERSDREIYVIIYYWGVTSCTAVWYIFTDISEENIPCIFKPAALLRNFEKSVYTASHPRIH
jgi:hypothetical protein